MGAVPAVSEKIVNSTGRIDCRKIARGGERLVGVLRDSGEQAAVFIYRHEGAAAGRRDRARCTVPLADHAVHGRFGKRQRQGNAAEGKDDEPHG